jgi:hypothetical protein
MFKRFWNLKIFVLAIQLAFILCFFTGIFWSSSGIYNSARNEVYDTYHWLYINRGLPTAWAGVSMTDKIVEFPIVKAPFLTQKTSEGTSVWSKIIDLKIFVPK